MEKKHKEILLLQRANLVDNLNMRKGLFTQLLCRKVIDQRMVRNIKNGKTEDDQAEELLDFLPKAETGAETFELFCEALIADSQSHIVKSFLKSEESSDSNETTAKCSSDQKSTENLSVSQSVVPENAETRGTTCSDSDGVGPSRATPSLVPQVAIQEEFQQHMYRRSIEPRSLQHTQSSPCFDRDAEHEAHVLYQTALRNSAAVSAAWEKQVLNKPLMDKSVYAQVSSSQLPESILHHSQSDGMLVKDSANFGQMQKGYMSSSGLNNPLFAQQPPSMFNLSSQNENLLSSPTQSNYQSKINPYERHLHVQDSYKSNSVGFGSPIRRRDSNFCDSASIDHGFVRNVENERLLNQQNQEIYSNRVNRQPQSSPLKYDRIGEPRFGIIERDCIEIPRYIEVNNNGDEGRTMMSLPRHVSRVTIPVQPSNNPSEEFSRGDNKTTARLARLDSVDTMHKRPNCEEIEHDSKRFREDVDTCSSPIIPSVSKLASIPVIDNKDRSIVKIPVIEEPRKKLSMPAVVIETDGQLEKCQMSSLLGAMDDPEIDLTDGPITVNVELSTRQFYLTHYKQAYAMRRIPRGKALIMNVNEVIGKSARRGTDIDRDNLHNLLCQMHFDVTVYNDSDGLTALEMIQKLQDFSQHNGHMTADCTAICILSHGEEGFIFGADGKKFELDAVFTLFDNTCCPNLRGKPKIFIIQACRGGALDRGVQYYPDEHDGSDARVRQVPSMSDMLICYPTQNGYYAWRNRDRGSWYVEALVQIFMKYAKCEDVCTMLNRVNLLVSKKVSHCPNVDMDQMSQMSEYKSTLRMPHLYFFPGIGGCS
ncbi:luteolysis [Mactra antiquata]